MRTHEAAPNPSILKSSFLPTQDGLGHFSRRRKENRPRGLPKKASLASGQLLLPCRLGIQWISAGDQPRWRTGEANPKIGPAPVEKSMDAPDMPSRLVSRVKIDGDRKGPAILPILLIFVIFNFAWLASRSARSVSPTDRPSPVRLLVFRRAIRPPTGGEPPVSLRQEGSSSRLSPRTGAPFRHSVRCIRAIRQARSRRGR